MVYPKSCLNGTKLMCLCCVLCSIHSFYVDKLSIVIVGITEIQLNGSKPFKIKLVDALSGYVYLWFHVHFW